MRAALLLLPLLAGACGDHGCPERGRESLAQCTESCERGEARACAWVGMHLETSARGGEESARRFSTACESADVDQRWLCALASREPPAGEVLGQLRAACGDGDAIACWAIARHATVSIPLEPPSERPDPPATAIVLTLEPGGRLLIDGEAVTVESLADRELPADRPVRIEADRRVAHGEMIRVIDALRAAGVTRYAINVTPER